MIKRMLLCTAPDNDGALQGPPPLMRIDERQTATARSARQLI
jgi:hypothetical protein